jgi:peroxiredoxin
MADATIRSNEVLRPVDDGAAAHLVGTVMPQIRLPSTAGGEMDVGEPRAGWTVFFCYPRTGVPGVALPDGWEAIPGAVGCTPQACSFRDRYTDLLAAEATIFGVSTQATDYQKEMAERLRLPYPVLSDARLRLAGALRLPTFEAAGMTLLKRLTLIVRDGRIGHVFYPVFPPEENAAQVLDWLQMQNEGP